MEMMSFGRDTTLVNIGQQWFQRRPQGNFHWFVFLLLLWEEGGIEYIRSTPTIELQAASVQSVNFLLL